MFPEGTAVAMQGPPRSRSSLKRPLEQHVLVARKVTRALFGAEMALLRVPSVGAQSVSIVLFHRATRLELMDITSHHRGLHRFYSHW